MYATRYLGLDQSVSIHCVESSLPCRTQWERHVHQHASYPLSSNRYTMGLHMDPCSCSNLLKMSIGSCDERILEILLNEMTIFVTPKNQWPMHPSLPRTALLKNKSQEQTTITSLLIHFALSRNSIQTLKLLVNEGVDLNLVPPINTNKLSNISVGTALHIIGHLVANVMLQSLMLGWDDGWHDTLLSSESTQTSEEPDLTFLAEATKVLLDAGCDVFAKDEFGRTAVDNCERNGKNKVSAIMRQEL